MMADAKLPDRLRPGLRLVICGTAAGTRSAARGAYYAGPGNQFWETLASNGLTPRQFRPAEFPLLLDHGIGLTDLVKHEAGPDSALSRTGWDVAGLREKLRSYQPRVVCFNGKRAAKEFFDSKDIEYGRQPDYPGLPGVVFFVAPSTSGAARGSWDEQHWRDLAALVGNE
jgi:TDG/mug DNA glycosylase family protein